MTAREAFSGSYAAGDVDFLLTPIEVATVDIAAKEALIQSGEAHYSELLSPESAPGPAYMAIFEAALAANGPRLAADIAGLAAAIATRAVPQPLALVSLARAGTPIGVLLHRELHRRGIETVHYSVSIVRDHGLDPAAMARVLRFHAPESVVFVDGWTGKGVIAAELRGPRGAPAAGIAPFLAVVADPAGRADLAATTADYVIPSGLLNGVVSGLVSRSVRSAALPAGAFHGCTNLDHLAAHDISRRFVDHLDRLVAAATPAGDWSPAAARDAAAGCDRLVATLMADYAVPDRNRIKAGIAEATRAMLRRVPDRLLLADPGGADVAHLVHLAAEKRLPITPLPAGSAYRAAAIITGAE